MIMSLARKTLALPKIYDAFQSLVGTPQAHERFIREMVHPESGERILDIGCGTGTCLRYLPRNIGYVGVDISEAYIAKARANYGDRAEFVCADVETLETKNLGKFDRAFSYGVLHHLSDDAAERVVELVQHVIKPGGTLVTIDPCREPGQHPIARLAIANDRGEHIRDAAGFERLVSGLGTVRTTIHHNLLRIPYTHIVMKVRVGPGS
jgi:SAM-dependent methyltransferase